MKKILKNFLVLFILIILIFNLTGCYDAKRIEEFAYVVAIGIDFIDNENIELTLQFAQTGKSSSSDDSSGSSQSSGSTITSVKCSSINSGVSLINGHISKKVSLSHCKEVIFSEKIAELGIAEHIYTLANDVGIRTDCNLVVSKCTAKDYLKNVKPLLETLTARYYEASLNSTEYTGYTVTSTLSDFYANMKDSYAQPYAILSGISIENSSSEPVPNADFTAGNIPLTDKAVTESLGIAVFKKDEFIGELTGLDSICHLIVTNQLKSCIFSIPNPFTENRYVDLRITSNKNTKCNVDYLNSSALISIDVSLVGYGLSLDENISYDSDENIRKLEESAEKYITEKIKKYLYLTSEEYESDICGFGRYVVKKHLTIQDWYKSNWLENYKYSFFDVNVNLTIKSGDLFTKS